MVERSLMSIYPKDVETDAYPIHAIAAYKAENDWLGHFLDERCEIGQELAVKSGELYQAYRAHAAANGEYVRSTTDFYATLEAEGFERQRTRATRMIEGLTLLE